MACYSAILKEIYDLQRFSIKMGLENITNLCTMLHNPQNSYPTIHVAGTNGKGTTSILIQKILAAHGLKVGLYTSPHLVDFRERIRINDNLIERQFICHFWNKIEFHIKKLKATFFDTTTAMAFQYFKIKKVDVAVIETGLGGRLDSTNILQPVAVVLTPVAVDHVNQLGIDLKNITREKAAIIKRGATLFIGKQHHDVAAVLKTYFNKTNISFGLKKAIKVINVKTFSTFSTFKIIDCMRGLTISNIKLNLASKFQIDNSCLAYLVARWYLEHYGINFETEKFKAVLENIKWLGRLQKIEGSPNIVLDVSHNHAGFVNTIDFIKKHYEREKSHLLIGLLADKQYELIVKEIYDHFRSIVVTEPIHERKLSGTLLHNELSKYRINVKLIKEIDKAFEFCIKNIDGDHTLFIMGSHFLIGRLLELMDKKGLT